MTDAEIHALASETLTRVLADLSSRLPANSFQAILLDSGEQAVLYGGTSEAGYGSFSCHYAPYPAIREIVAYCNSVYDEFLEITDASRRVEFEAVRSVAVKAMVDCATLHLLFSFITRLEDMVEDAVEDSYVVGKGLAVASVAKYLTNTEHREFTADARPAIEQAVQRAAEKRRKVIRTHFKGLPSLLSERGRGAPIKPQSVRARERDAYAAKVEVAYRKIRNLTGKKPTKISVAKELGEGGLNLKSGIDSSAAAFRNKLTRLGIDYDAIKARIEAETKQ